MFNTKTFGAYLSRLRRSADMTQSELAEKLSLTRQAISKYETGDSFPDISILVEIANIYEVTFDDLINSGNPTKGETRMLRNINSNDNDDPVNINDIVFEILCAMRNNCNALFNQMRDNSPNSYPIAVRLRL